MKEILIRNLASLATPRGNGPQQGKAMGQILELQHPYVLIREGKIAAIGGPELEENLSPGAVLLDGEGKTLLPGFVDAHTHLVFGGTREEEFAMRLRGESYMAIMEKGGGIRSTVKHTREASEEELLKTGWARLQAMAEQGVTTVEAKSGYGLDRETELKQLRVAKKLNGLGGPAVVSTFMGAHDIPEEYTGQNEAYLAYLVEEVLPFVRVEQLAEFADIFTEKKVFSVEESRVYLTQCQEAGLKLKIHADEIHDLGGAQLAAELHCVSADHLLKANEAGLKAMAKAGVMAVLLPLTAFSLKEPYAPARKLIDEGLAVALATDFNPGSSFSHSMPLVIALGCLQMGMTPEEVLTAVTLNGAAALNRAHLTGSLEVGKAADLILIDAPSYRFLPYHFGMNQVVLTMKGGNILYQKQTREVNHGRI